MDSVINRYYDPTTDQFLSVDPEVATTDQPYVFVNDDSLNSEDPLGMCGICNFIEGVVSTAAPVPYLIFRVSKYVVENPMSTLGLGLDGGSLTLDITGAATDEPAVSLSGAMLGVAGTKISYDECSSKNQIACGGAIVGGLAALTGGAEAGLELYAMSPYTAQPVVQGLGLNFSASAVVADISGLVVKVLTKAKSKPKK